MSDERTFENGLDGTARWEPDNDPDGYTHIDVIPKDLFFDTVLDFMLGFSDEHDGNSIGLTVTTNGAMVSGHAITRAEWLAGVANQIRQAGAAETATHVEELFRDVHEAIIETADRRDEADLPARARQFLHMKQARIGTGTATTQVAFWRGSLADISSWSLGTCAGNPPEH